MNTPRSCFSRSIRAVGSLSAVVGPAGKKHKSGAELWLQHCERSGDDEKNADVATAIGDIQVQISTVQRLHIEHEKRFPGEQSVAILAQAISCSNVRMIFLRHELFWFCLVQVSTTQFCCFPPFLMARIDDASDRPVPPSPVQLTSSKFGSPNGSVPDVDGMGERSAISRASFRRLPRNGKSFFTTVSLHINNQFAKKRGIGKKLLLTIRAVMLEEHVDLVVGDFNGAAWRRPCGSDRKLTSIIEEAFADATCLPTLVGARCSARRMGCCMRIYQAMELR